MDEQAHVSPSKWMALERFQTDLDVNPLGLRKSLVCLQKLNDLLSSI